MKKRRKVYWEIYEDLETDIKRFNRIMNGIADERKKHRDAEALMISELSVSMENLLGHLERIKGKLKETRK